MTKPTFFFAIAIVLSLVPGQRFSHAADVIAEGRPFMETATEGLEIADAPELQSSRRARPFKQTSAVERAMKPDRAAVVAPSTMRPPLNQDRLETFAGRLLTALSLVAVLFLAVVFVAKRQRSSAVAGMATQLRLLSTLNIAPRCCLSLVWANGQEFLVARDATGVKQIVPLQRSFDSFVADSSADTDPLSAQVAGLHSR